MSVKEGWILHFFVLIWALGFLRLFYMKENIIFSCFSEMVYGKANVKLFKFWSNKLYTTTNRKEALPWDWGAGRGQVGAPGEKEATAHLFKLHLHISS